MDKDDEVTQVGPDRTRCTGRAARPHAPVEIVLRGDRIVVCPLCGRRFRHAAPPDRTNPAKWPEGD